MRKIVTGTIETGCSFDLTPLQRFVREQIMPGLRDREARGDFPLAAFRGLYDMGLLQAFVPEALGGVGAPTSDLLWIFRELGYGSPGVATSMAGTILSYVPIAYHGTEQLKREVFGSFMKEFALAAFAFTEPDAGSDVLSIQTKATRTDKGYVLTGRKCLITNANHAKHFVVLAKVEGVANPKQAITAFYVPAETRGFSHGQPYRKLGHSDSDTGEIFFDGVEIPAHYRLGEEGNGLRIGFHSLGRSRLFFAAAAMGLCDRAFNLVGEDLGARIRFGKPALAQPVIQHTIAQLRTEQQAAWLLTCAAGTEWDAGTTSLLQSSMAKLYSGQVVGRVASTALELFGGWGYLREFEIERIFRDAKLYEIIEGPSMVQQALIAKELYPEIARGRSVDAAPVRKAA